MGPANLAAWLDDPATRWTKVTFPQWYDPQNKELELTTGTAIWYHVGMPPVPLRWVLLRDPAGKGEPAALLCTDPGLAATGIVIHFTGRWCEEVTWYHKTVAIFSDALAAVRRSIWERALLCMSGPDAQTCIIPRRWINS